MSSVAPNSPLSPVAQSRRSACDRCHQHKLKCERYDVRSVETVADSSLTACKRCMKAKVQCRMATNSSSSSSSTDNNNNTNNNRAAKRKGTHDEDEGTHEKATSTGIIFSAAFPTDVAVSSDQITSSGPGGSSLPSTDDALLSNVGAFDFGAGDFSERGTLAVSPTSFLFGNAAPQTQAALGEDDRLEPPRGVQHSYLDGLDMTLFGDDSNPLQSNEILTASSGNPLLSSQTPEPSTVPTTTEPDSSSSPYDMHDDCRRRLQSLHTTIFSELHHLSGADMDRLLSGRYDTTSLVHPEGSGGCDDHGGFIQKLLFASERLIELLRILDLAYAGVTHGHDLESYPSSSQPCDSCDSILSGHHHHSHSATSTPRHSLHPVPRSQMSFLRSRRTSSAFSPPAAPPPQPTSSSDVDLPVIVSFLTCYVGLMVIYRHVLAQALNSLRSTDPYRHLRARPGSSGSPIAGSSFGNGSTGYTATVSRRDVPALGALGANYDAGSSNSSSSSSPQQALRIRILTEVLSHMIERVEDAWDSVTTEEHGDLGCEDKHSYHHHHQQQQQQQQQPHSRHGGCGVADCRARAIYLSRLPDPISHATSARVRAFGWQMNNRVERLYLAHTLRAEAKNPESTRVWTLQTLTKSGNKKGKKKKGKKAKKTKKAAKAKKVRLALSDGVIKYAESVQALCINLKADD
ncbi:hypothetical protein PG996_006018 [Apiospora saccharicola]|uniref:Zn(2)-C6 fungal-type domain-containing protein n=1 Tax=Apiospora saccharicola TaxID=335842 RepID=A0ABR1VN31_9PEZI